MVKPTFAQRVALYLRQVPGILFIGNVLWRLVQPRFTVGAVGVVFDSNGGVLLAAHAFHTKHTWGLPGGWVDRNEDPAVTVRREMMEELSLAVEVGPVLLAERPYRNHIDLAFLCRAHGIPGQLNYEVTECAWFKQDELPEILDVHRRAIIRARELMRLLGSEKWA
jgi:ADP-ribose pyrophosphatase YjhB (NUDIX family)